MENGWVAKSGTDTIRTKRRTTAQQEERHGLELTEYQQILAAPDSPDLTPQENAETRAVTELMRWSGLRISDAHKFNDSELVFNERGDGWSVDFIQKKTKKRCICPVPDHVVKMLQALPGRLEGGRKYLFTCSYTALRERVSTLAAKAQREKPFSHAFSPHCLRHTFAIQHFHEGTPVQLVSKWLGHESAAVTVKHYQNWIGSTRQVAEKVSRDANAGMLAKAVALQTGHTQTGRSLPPRPSGPGIVSDLEQEMDILDEALSNPFVGIAHEFAQFGKSDAFRDAGDNHVKRGQLVISERSMCRCVLRLRSYSFSHLFFFHKSRSISASRTIASNGTTAQA